MGGRPIGGFSGTNPSLTVRARGCALPWKSVPLEKERSMCDNGETSMAFKLPEKKLTCPDDPEALFRDLRKKTVPGLLSHQADVLRSYIAVHTQYPDIALQLPAGSGKRLGGLLLAE